MDSQITAKWARETAQSKISTKDSIVLEEIESRIRKEVSNGFMYLYYYGPISSKVSEELRINRGFVLENLSTQREGTCYKINW